MLAFTRLICPAAQHKTSYTTFPDLNSTWHTALISLILRFITDFGSRKIKRGGETAGSEKGRDLWEMKQTLGGWDGTSDAGPVFQGAGWG